MPKNENRKKVQEPVNECPLLAKGAIMAEVEAAKPRGTVKTKVTDVQVFASGPSAPDKPKKTNSSGRADFQELTVGDYTVRVELPGKMADYYEDVPAAQSKPVTAGKTTVYFFRLMAVYVEYFVKYPNGKAAEGFDFVLRVLKASGTEWEEQQKGKIGKAKVSEDFVPKGRYRLEVKYVHEAKWGAAEAVVGEPIDMSALAPGSDSGAAGTFDIFDARNLEAAIDTVSAKVDGDEALKAAWTPAKDKLASLKGSLVVFRAKVGTAFAYSPAVSLVLKEKFEVVDPKGKKLDAHLDVQFSSGAKVSADAAAGEAEVKVPWGESIQRLSLPGNKNSHVSLVPDGGTAQKFQTPA